MDGSARSGWRFGGRGSAGFFRRLVVALAVGVPVVALAPQVAAASTFQVSNSCNSGKGSLRTAVAKANTDASPPETITFASPLMSSVSCPSTNTITLAGSPITIMKSVTITGPGASSLAVSGNHVVTVFHVNSGATVRISGLTIENGTAKPGKAEADTSTNIGSNQRLKLKGGNGGNGGGIYNAGTLMLSNDTVTGNTSGSGGAGGNDTVAITGSTNTVTFTGGNGGNGGGIYNVGGLTLTNDTVTANSTGSGGNGGTSTVSDTALSTHNTVTLTGGNGGNGGGVYNAGTLTLHTATVTGNTTGSGGNPGPGNLTLLGTGDTINFGVGANGIGDDIYPPA
jgi:hypothetical protein